MRRRMSMVVVGLLGVGLVGWAALAWGQAVVIPPAPAATAPKTPASEPTYLPSPDELKPAGAVPTPPAATGAGPMVPVPPPAGPVVPASFTPPAPPPAPSDMPLPPPVPTPPPPAPAESMNPTLPAVVPPLVTTPTVIRPTTPAPVAPPNPEVNPVSGQRPTVIPPTTLPKLGGTPLPTPAEATTVYKPAKAIEDSKPAEVQLTPDSPLGRQEPAISMEWVGPGVAKVGMPQDYVLALKNTCNIPLQEVLVRVSLPPGMKVETAEPKAEVENNVYVWRVGTMLSRQEKNIQMKLTADARGDAVPKAWVTFTGMSVLRIKVREAKLVLQTVAQDKVMVGDAAAFTLTVTNPGDGSADQVKLHAKLSDGLEHGRGNEVNFEIGNLQAGETRSVQLICGTRQGGPQKCDCIAEADGGLTAASQGIVNVIMPRLDLQVVGPGLRYLDRKALYTLKVTNPGDAPATNVTVGDVVPAGFKVLAASDGGRHDYNTRTISWFLGEIGPGQTREVKFEAQAVEQGEQKHKASAIGARGLRAESELTTRVEGLSALMLDLVVTEDPIEVGAETTYEVRITNTGSKTETDIKLVATVPDKMEFKTSQGPAPFHAEGKTITFDPIDKLAPHADAFFKIHVKALEPGTVRFKTQVTSANLSEPVIRVEPTRIYSDTPDIKPVPDK